MSLLAKRLDQVTPSTTTGGAWRAAERAGARIMNLAGSQPERELSAHVGEFVKAAFESAVDLGHDPGGSEALKLSIAGMLAQKISLSYGNDEIIVCSGGKQVAFNAFLATLEADDEVLIPAPFWPRYPDMVRLTSGTPVVVECGSEEGFKLNPERLASALTSRTKWIVLSDPNPAGACYSAEELHLLSEELLAWPDVLILSDEVHGQIVLDGRSHYSILTLEPALRDRTLYCGVSSAFPGAAWSVGYGAGPNWLVNTMSTIQANSTSDPGLVLQEAARNAISYPDFLSPRLLALQLRRAKCRGWLNAIDGISCSDSGGTIFLFPSCRGLLGRRTPAGAKLDSDAAFARYLLDYAGVAVRAGSEFGLSPHFRISIAESPELLEEACAAISSACARLIQVHPPKKESF